MTCIAYAEGDAYEIIYSSSTVESIVRYKHGLDGHGEVVDYDLLSPSIQRAIFNRLRKALIHDSTIEPDNELVEGRSESATLDSDEL